MSGAPQKATITYDTWPDLKNWGCTEWILFHKALVNHLGKTKANEVWINWFKELSVWSSVYNWCKYKSDFSEYLKGQGINVGNIFSDIYNSASSAAKTGLSLLNFAIRILPVAAVGVGVWWLTKNTAAGRGAARSFAAGYRRDTTPVKRKRKK